MNQNKCRIQKKRTFLIQNCKQYKNSTIRKETKIKLDFYLIVKRVDIFSGKFFASQALTWKTSNYTVFIPLILFLYFN